MKKHFLLAMSVIIMAACSSSDHEPVNTTPTPVDPNAPVAAIFFPGIAGQVQTRAANAAWGDQDKIGIFDVTGKVTSFVNVEYTYTLSGTSWSGTDSNFQSLLS